MEKGHTYVYFALTGDNFDPQIVTERIDVTPTEKWNKGDKGKYNPTLDYSCWKLSTEKGKECMMVDILVDEVIGQLFDKIEIINELKKQFDLYSVLEIVLYLDTNEKQSTPSLGYNLKTIEFLHRTQTVIDVDIYRFNSSNNEAEKKSL